MITIIIIIPSPSYTDADGNFKIIIVMKACLSQALMMMMMIIMRGDDT
jgi:hypothetical protein